MIVKAIGGFYYVLVPEDGTICRCRARGRFKKEGLSIVVGDDVEFSHLSATEGVLESIFSRRTILKRPAIANIEQVIVICSILDPPLSLQLVDRLLVLAEERQIGAVICLNKVDLAKDDEILKVQDLYISLGYDVICTSALHGNGIDLLKDALAGKVSVLSGSSGVGKSTLLNKLYDEIEDQRTGDISEKLGRGRHTTRHVELFPLKGGGMVADTPGFSQLSLEGIDDQQLPLCFPEFKKYADQCRYSNCRHNNEPDCGVRDALMDGHISASRYNNYLSFLAEVQDRKEP